MSGSKDLVAGEGVDEGSADASTEAPRGPGGGDVLGEPPHGAPDDGARDAAPEDLETEQSRAARATGPGQQYSVGEG